LLGNDPVLREIQAWVVRKSNRFQTEQLGSIQSLYWYIVLDTAHFDARIRISTLEIARALRNIRDFTYKLLDNQTYMVVVLPRAQSLVDFNDFLFSYGQNISEEMDFSFYFDDAAISQLSNVEKAIVLDVALLFALSISHFFTLDSRREELKPQYDNVVKYFHKLKDFSKDISPSLNRSLSSLKMPRRSADYSDWESFEKKFRDICIRNSDIGHQWSLTGASIESLRKYLVANSIILDALPVAYINDRTQVLAKVFKKFKD